MISELDSLMEHSPDILVVFDRNTCITEISRQGSLHLGFPTGDIIGKRITELIGTSSAEIEDRVRQAFEKGAPVSSEHEVPTTHGLHCFSATYTPLPGSSGDVEKVFAVWRDISGDSSGKKKTEETAKAGAVEINQNSRTLSKEHIFSTAILETVKALIVVMDSNGCIIRQNNSFEKLTGLSPSGTKGKSFLSVFSLADSSGADVSSFTDLAGYHSVGEYESHWTGPGLRSKYFTWSVLPLFDENGSVEFFIATGIDITERKLAEDALKESENKVRALIEYAPVGIVIVDAKGSITLVNEKTESLFRYGRDELVGKPVETLIPSRFRENHREHLARFAAEPSLRLMGRGQELSVLASDGQEIPAEIALSYVDTKDGRLYLCFLTDISERKAAEEELMKTRQEFISILTHDLKAPLASVMGFMDLMERSLGKNKMAKEQEYSALIRHSCNVMLNLIQNIVESSRIDSQKFTFNFDTFNLSELISELRKSYSPLTDREHITLDFRCPEDMMVKADKAKMRQAFHNLLSNAIRFTPRHGTIGIIAEKESGRAAVKVYDKGKGIDLAEQKHLFTKFTQVRGERRGTGLGLYIVKNILEGHGSDVILKSAPGEGTSFFFSLPLAG